MKIKKNMYTVTLIAAAVVLLVTVLTVRASQTDDRIESSARNSYVFKTYLKGDDIKIQSKDNIVTLTGVVSEESNRRLAKETVAELPGVKSVDNKLVVKGTPPTANSDAWLSEKVKFTLLFHRNVSGSKTNVQVKDGIVTLSGKASSNAQKELTTEYTKDIEGVKDIKNEMTVPDTYEKTISQEIVETMGGIMESIDDASITALVKTTLMYHRSTSALNTIVKTNAGEVNLGGTAKNAAEKDLVAKYVSDVYGVKSVVNNITII